MIRGKLPGFCLLAKGVRSVSTPGRMNGTFLGVVVPERCREGSGGPDSSWAGHSCTYQACQVTQPTSPQCSPIL